MKLQTHLPSLFIQTQTHLLQSCISNQTALHLYTNPIHAQSIVSGLISSDLFFTNLLLNAYSKSGSLQDARKLFDRMPQRNLISWSSMISMHTQFNQHEKALSLFSDFRSSSFECPNEFILASVLKACTRSGTVERAYQIHCLSIRMAYHMDVFVGTALVDFYCKSGLMEGAMNVFDELPVRNSVTWTTIIAGYSKIGQSDVSLKLFHRMSESEVEPDRFVISSVISACLALGYLEGGRQAHGYAYRNGTEMDVSVKNVLIDLYCKCSRVGIARRVFDFMGAKKNLVSWTTMISGYMQNSSHQDAMILFAEMSRLGFWPDAFACTSILSSCGSLMALEQGKQVHGYCIKANIETDDFVKNGLIDMYSKCESLFDARVVFDLMKSHNGISYNAMIEGYANARHEELMEAIALFSRLRKTESLHPTLLTFVSLLRGSASLSLVELSKQIHGLITKSGFSLDLYAGSALVNVYSKCSCLNDARAVFDEMNEKDIAVWNAMISGYMQNDGGEEAFKILHQLCVCGFRPDERTFIALISAASNQASLFHGLQFHNQIIKAGVDSDPHVLNALIDMYAKCGCIREARLLFDSSTCGRDVFCYNSMISRYAQHGHSEEALKVFQLMREEEIEPSYVSFVGVLSACGNVGLVEEGLNHFNSMRRDFGIEPGMEHYASVVNLLGRAGKLNEAKEFIEGMPIEPAAIVWRSLLGSCRVFGDVELGKYAAERAISMEPQGSGPYVLMSNIYASKGMWGDSENLRKGMDTKVKTKEPGYSWI